eukprot:1319133-Pyramimonas_sp.AAC.1
MDWLAGGCFVFALKKATGDLFDLWGLFDFLFAESLSIACCCEVVPAAVCEPLLASEHSAPAA